MAESPDYDKDPAWIMERLKRLDVRIESQYMQIHNRYTWFLVTQGFLFTSYALTLANRPSGPLEEVWRVMFFGLPLLACVSVVVSTVSIHAHKDFIEHLKPMRQKLTEMGARFQLENAEAPINSYWHRNGLLSIVYPSFLLLFWLACLGFAIHSVVALNP
jgi:hypothetical protein